MTQKTHLSTRLDDETRESLAILGAVDGMSQREQVAWALKWAAHCLENAWAQGAVPLGRIPDMKAVYRRPVSRDVPCDERVTQVRAVIAEMQRQEGDTLKEPEEPQPSPEEETETVSIQDRVREAVRELREAGHTVSGTTVAKRAGIGRSTACRYLKELGETVRTPQETGQLALGG
ncbi:hypothetical protein ACFRCI_17395 [Streptomyces sp. NPDC056638]|uniref:hypothetical protein n=1 Tax=Streptomyces sp. NPDC056638 TaxID=3345887 RepID=UPI0036C88D5E